MDGSTGHKAPGLQVSDRPFARVLSGHVANRLSRFYMQQCMQDGGCLLRYDDRGPRGEDLPDSMTRLSAGRLSDGRHYLCNNAFPTLLNRRYLMLLLSDDGYLFDDVHMPADDPTAQRLAGLLKVDGFQYPCCLPDGDRLLVGYSVNKEDIECASVDCTQQ